MAEPKHNLVLRETDASLLNFLKLEAKITILAVLHHDYHIVILDEFILVLYHVIAIKFSKEICFKNGGISLVISFESDFFRNKEFMLQT